MTVLLTLIGIVVVITCIVLFIHKSHADKALQQKSIEITQVEQKLESLSREAIAWNKERSLLLEEKQKFEEKNKKLWQMSETVHKERKLVDEANEALVLAKEKLEGEKKKLDEKVKKLWSTSTAIHKEKERINELKLIIEHKHQEILDSVNYAQRIQRALLASAELLHQHIPEHFVLFEPKDIVSGDFYWADVLPDGKFAILTADSTGHGVPGAIMSILNISCIEKAVQSEKFSDPSEILNHTRIKIIETLKKDGSEEGGKDGMDCSLLKFDFENKQLIYAAANNPVWVVRTSPETESEPQLIELNPDKMPVGKHDHDHLSFNQHRFHMLKGDMIYALTDGLPDQFGGPKGKKFMYKKLKELLVQLSGLPAEEQKKQLLNTLHEWKGDLEQVDDITLIGIRI